MAAAVQNRKVNTAQPAPRAASGAARRSTSMEVMKPRIRKNTTEHTISRPTPTAQSREVRPWCSYPGGGAAVPMVLAPVALSSTTLPV